MGVNTPGHEVLPGNDDVLAVVGVDEQSCRRPELDR